MVTSTNRLSSFSLVSALLTVLSFCIGMAPIPLTAWVCYPLAILFGLAALITGFIALRQIRFSGEKGRASAWIGIWLGLFSLLAVLCFTTLTVLVVYYGADYLKTFWAQLNP